MDRTTAKDEPLGPWSARGRSAWRFVSVVALVVVASMTLTVFLMRSMAKQQDMLMPGGWHLSMLWRLMPGQTWLGASVMFLGMWVVMMVAMMLPSLLPVLWRYRQAVDGAVGRRSGWLTLLLALGYFTQWALLGVVVFAGGCTLATIELSSPRLAGTVPVATGGLLLIAGLLQLSAWKQHQLRCCRTAPKREDFLTGNARSAWRLGLHLGWRCCRCCISLTVPLLVFGVMDLRAMVLVMMAVTLERLGPAAQRTARLIGVGIIGAGVFLIGEAAGLL